MSEQELRPGDICVGELLGALVHRVFLDGVPTLYVHRANVARGIVECVPQDAEGRFIFDHDKEEYVVEKRRGKVTVTWTDEAKARKWIAAMGHDPRLYGLEPEPR